MIPDQEFPDFDEQGEVHYVLSNVLRNVHGRLIQTYGGVPGVRDENALESAVSRPKQVAHYARTRSIGTLGGALSWALLRSHAFIDGNKRIALASLIIFAERNGYRLACSEVEETAMVLRAASGEIAEEQWMAWVESVVVPRREDTK